MRCIRRIICMGFAFFTINSFYSIQAMQDTSKTTIRVRDLHQEALRKLAHVQTLLTMLVTGELNKNQLTEDQKAGVRTNLKNTIEALKAIAAKYSAALYLQGAQQQGEELATIINEISDAANEVLNKAPMFTLNKDQKTLLAARLKSAQEIVEANKDFNLTPEQEKQAQQLLDAFNDDLAKLGAVGVVQNAINQIKIEEERERLEKEQDRPDQEK